MSIPQQEIAIFVALGGIIFGFVGAACALVGGAIAYYNSRKAVLWKRAELANSYLRDLNNNPELVFACRCLDWNGGRLPLPDSLRGINGDCKFIDHDRRVFKNALRPDLVIGDFAEDQRIQIYRIATDSFLSWLGLVAGALERNLFVVKDIEEVGYWISKIKSEPVLHPFIHSYGYGGSFEKLSSLFKKNTGAYQYWFFPTNTAGQSKPHDASSQMEIGKE